MKTGLVFTMISLTFLLILMFCYYAKENSKATNSRLYRIIMLSIFFTEVFEIFAYCYFIQCGYDFLTIIFLRLRWLCNFITYLSFFTYIIYYSRPKAANSIKELFLEDKRCKYFTIFSLICLIMFWFVPLEKMTYETLAYLPGPATYFMLMYGNITVIYIIYGLITKKIYDTRIRKVNIMLIALMGISIPFQVIFPRISFFGIISTLHVYFIYLYIENPDLIMASSLENLKKDVERSNMAKTDFLSNMSHEIRSPMNAIVGFSDTILNDPNFDEASVRADIKHIATAGTNLLDIINNILDVSKIETGNETIEEKEYSIGNVIMELSSIIDARIDNRPVKFITEVDPQIPKKVYGDSTKIFQVLLNILTNSIKYTEVGKINLTVNKELKGNNVVLKFKVSDTGYGIKKEDYDNLFQKFSRLDSATTNEIEGTGLGLVITKRYVDLLGGKIWFESDYGVGTTFYVEVTQRIVDFTPIGTIHEAQGTELNDESFLDCTGKRVLVVDDNMLNIKVAKRILEKYHLTIDSVTTGRECVFKIKEGQQYDMIFLDHMMPEMDGIEVVHILKKLQGFKIPPVVALTANAITGVKDMYLREGFDEYLSKPINIGELNHIINRYFGQGE